jgi:hypothetical protein
MAVTVVVLNYAIESDNRVATLIYENVICSSELYVVHFTRGKFVLPPVIEVN